MKWRWDRKDLGYRFSLGRRNAQDFYEGLRDGDYYAVPKRHRKKLLKNVIARFYNGATAPDAYEITACPWSDYDLHWDHIVDAHGWLLNFAGCLDHAEVQRQEDLGVGRAFEFVSSLHVDTRLTVDLVRDLHRELMGDVYPFAGDYRTVTVSKDGMRWPPPWNIDNLMRQLETAMFSRTPLYISDRDALCLFVAELMSELLAIHPFREGNGRVARLVGSLLFLQNDLPPISQWHRERDATEYIDASRAGMVREYTPLAAVLRRWLDAETQGEA